LKDERAFTKRQGRRARAVVRVPGEAGMGTGRMGRMVRADRSDGSYPDFPSVERTPAAVYAALTAEMNGLFTATGAYEEAP